MIKILQYFLQSLIVYFFFIIGIFFGLRKSQKFFSKIFRILGPKFKSKITIDKNLSIFNPEFSTMEKNDISSHMWSSYGKTFIEYVFLDKYRKDNKYINLENKNILDIVKKRNKPVIFVSGHFANFELMSMELTKQNIKLATIYRPLNNFFLNPFMEFQRKKYVCKNQIKKGRAGVRDAMKYIDKGYSIALMIDQRVSEGEIVNLFNEPALTTTLPAQLALKYNLDIVPVFIEREKNNDYRVMFYSPIDINKFKNKLDLSKHLNNQLESMLLKNPEQWIWTHNRWKL
jgi:KDO2-lipid IV(A) lauroyltransferase